MYLKIILVLLVFWVSKSTNAQQKLETTALNRITLIKNDTSYIFFVLKSGKKKSVKPDMNYYWFRPDTILITNSGFGGKLLNGEYKVFYPNKNIKESGFFDYGLKTGEWMEWNEKGRVVQIYNWKKGYLNVNSG